jgi:hypothetical protein
VTLVTDAQALLVLAEQAGSAADRSTTDAALGVVLERLERAHARVTHGVLSSPWWEELSQNDRDAVMKAVVRAAAAVRPLADQVDSVAASYGRHDDAASRGALGEINRAFALLAETVQDAQDSLLRTWSQDVWPAERMSELDIHAIVPESRKEAESVLRVAHRLHDDLDARRALVVPDLRRRREDVLDAASRAEPLRERPVPASVLEVFRATVGEAEVSLEAVTSDALQWLADHGGARLFVVHRMRA